MESDRSRDMNCIELLILIGITVLAYTCAYCALYFGRSLGIVNFTGGFVFGLLVIVSLIVGVVRLFQKVCSIGGRCRPRCPPCKNGKCLEDDYTVVGLRKHDGDVDILYQCRCGTKYLLAGRQFLEIREDGSAIHYMKKNYSGVWSNDSGGSKRGRS